MSKLQHLVLLQQRVTQLERGNALLAEITKEHPSEMNKICMRTIKEQILVLKRELALRSLKLK
jgi:hypothetical protein